MGLNNIVRCDAKDCTSHVEWNQEDLAKPNAKLDDKFFQLQVLQVWVNDPESGQPVQKTFTFCSRACVLSFERDYVPAKSPRQLREEIEKRQSAIAAARTAARANAPAPETVDTQQEQPTDDERKVIAFRKPVEPEPQAPATSRDETVELPAPSLSEGA
ncbi:MAG: hypothetical protein JWQ87_2035 [Candidatus Sulfotelmatobacter sp.]|nr:hypothetical protein [Candidatus Sulfotelmatobacter sp.]